MITFYLCFYILLLFSFLCFLLDCIYEQTKPNNDEDDLKIDVKVDPRQMTFTIFPPFPPGIANIDVSEPGLANLIRLSFEQSPLSGKLMHVRNYPQIVLHGEGQSFDVIYYTLWFARLFSHHSFMSSSHSIYMTFKEENDEALRAWSLLITEGVIKHVDSEQPFVKRGTYVPLEQDLSPSEYILQLVMHVLENKMFVNHSTIRSWYKTSKKREEELRKAYSGDASFHCTNTTSLIHGIILKGMFPNMHIMVKKDYCLEESFQLLYQFAESFRLF